MQHPIRAAGGTKQHVKAFEAIAIGQTPRCHPQTLEWLINHDFVQRLPDKVVGRDRFGTITVPDFAVPVWAHSAWCEWASFQHATDR